MNSNRSGDQCSAWPYRFEYCSIFPHDDIALGVDTQDIDIRVVRSDRVGDEAIERDKVAVDPISGPLCERAGRSDIGITGDINLTTDGGNRGWRK